MKQEWTDQIAELLEQLSHHEVPAAPGASEQLIAYCEAVFSWSDRIGLISPHDKPQFVTKHIAASCGPLLMVKPGGGEKWIDVGTGGGLPGMVIKICRPEIDMTLLDSSQKKTWFLQGFQEEHKIEDLRVLTARVEDLNRDYYKYQAAKDLSAKKLEKRRGGNRNHKSYSADRRRQTPVTVPKEEVFDVVLMRAVSSINKSIPLIDTVTKPGSHLITFKGPRWQEELSEGEQTLAQKGWSLVEAKQIPFAQPKLLKLIKGELQV